MQNSKNKRDLAANNYYLLNAILMVLCIVMCQIDLGCSHVVADPRGERYPVSGEVTFNEVPLANGRISFLSIEGDAKLQATGSIVDGKYEIKKANGPLKGKMRVEIQEEMMEVEELESRRGANHKLSPARFQTVKIPSQFNRKSTLTANIEANDANQKDFHLVAKVK